MDNFSISVIFTGLFWALRNVRAEPLANACLGVASASMYLTYVIYREIVKRSYKSTWSLPEGEDKPEDEDEPEGEVDLDSLDDNQEPPREPNTPEDSDVPNENIEPDTEIPDKSEIPMISISRFIPSCVCRGCPLVYPDDHILVRPLSLDSQPQAEPQAEVQAEVQPEVQPQAQPQAQPEVPEVNTLVEAQAVDPLIQEVRDALQGLQVALEHLEPPLAPLLKKPPKSTEAVAVAHNPHFYEWQTRANGVKPPEPPESTEAKAEPPEPPETKAEPPEAQPEVKAEPTEVKAEPPESTEAQPEVAVKTQIPSVIEVGSTTMLHSQYDDPRRGRLRFCVPC